MIRTAVTIARDALRAFSWQKILLAQLLAGAFDVVAILLFVRPGVTPPSFTWSRLIIEEIMAFSILSAALIADQMVARGARAFRAYAVAILLASLFSGVAQYHVRGWFGVYTNVDRPNAPPGAQRGQVIYVIGDTLTYGVLFILVYLDHRQREQLLRRVRSAELERERRKQRLVESRLSALRADVDAAALMTTLTNLQFLFERDVPSAERQLDDLIASLREKLSPAESDRARQATA
jgi:hypothetical protein